MATPTDAAEAPETSASQTPLQTTAAPQQSNGSAQAPSTDAAKVAPLKSAMKQKSSKPIEGDASGDGKLSGAELKKRAKEEKAARRAAEKAEKDVASASGPSNSSPALTKGAPPQAQKPAQKDAARTQHRRTGSHGAAGQGVALPLRGKTAPAPGGAAVKEPKRANKEVGLFGHLYTQPKRQTLEGVSKEVHPAVLALGLQMSSYVVCGSNARCVGMLLAFKKVRLLPPVL